MEWIDPFLGRIANQIPSVSSPFDQNLVAGIAWCFTLYQHSWWSWISISRFIWEYHKSWPILKGFSCERSIRKSGWRSAFFWPTCQVFIRYCQSTENLALLDPYFLLLSFVEKSTCPQYGLEGSGRSSCSIARRKGFAVVTRRIS